MSYLHQPWYSEIYLEIPFVSKNPGLRNFMVKYLQFRGGLLTTPPSATGGF
jgi:hypothetical protein